MKKLLILVTALLLTGLAGLPAQNVVDLDLYEEFNRKLAEQSVLTNSIKCRFAETKSFSMIEKPVVADGDFYYLKDNNIALLYDAPEGDRIVMSGGQFKIVSNGHANTMSMSSNPMLRQLNAMLTACFTGDISMLTKGAGTVFSQTDRAYVVEITPQERRMRQYMSRITLVFDKKDMTLDSMKVEEASGDYTEYSFSGKVVNGDVDAEVFKI